MQCGLLGRKLSHSYSPQIHSQLADYGYCLFEKEPEELEVFLRSDSFSGINVTIPYKKAVIEYCDDLSPRAQRLGAVNTLVRRPNGRLVGHNTDYFGFDSMLNRTGLDPRGKKVLVLGSGGASATAVAVLRDHGAAVTVISRTGENNYENLHLHADASIIVNTSPVGMYPDTEASPVTLSQFPHLEGVLDLIYNPANTALLQQAQARGLIAQNGLWMLVAQAKESAEWFSGETIPDEQIGKIYQRLRTQMENLILIGMPGCGKTTIGSLLADSLGKTFVDADAEIVKLSGKSIPDIFSQDGEAVFRELETQVLHNLGKQSGLVISTGGGCVTQSRNYPLLHRNGTIIWLQRDIKDLPTNGRPLSMNSSLSKMYEIRKPMYEAFCDYSISNNGAVGDTVGNIVKLLDTEVYL